MAIQNIAAQSLKPALNFKRKQKSESTETHKKHSTGKTIAWTTAGVAAAAALTIAGIKMAKSGKTNKIVQKFNNIINKQKEEIHFRGTKTKSFESPKAMADEIVNDFNAMKKRVKGHNLKQYQYNQMDWTAAPVARTEVIK